MFKNIPIYYAADGDAGNPPPVTPPAPGADTWYGKAGIAPEHHDFIKGKEFADLNTVISSHRNLESMVGRNRLAVPLNAEDKEAYENIYKTLGRPDKPEYKLPETIKFNEDTWKKFQPVAFEKGLSQGQVEAIADWYFKEGTAAEQAKAVEKANRETADVAALEKEWGSAKAGNMDLAQRAFRHLGLDADTVGAVEDALGYKATMQLFHKIGAGLREDTFHQDESKGAGKGETAETVQTKINDLLKNQEFKDRYNNHDPRVRAGAIKEMEALQIKLAEIQQKSAAAV
jgi:hypothetical protein